jgi:hypothetical protein
MGDRLIVTLSDSEGSLDSSGAQGDVKMTARIIKRT